MNRSLPLIAKWVAIGAALAVLLWIAGIVASKGLVIPVVGIGLLGAAILVVYGTRRNIPAKYLFPGLVFMVALQIWPIVYTVATSLTNYGPSHQLSKEESVKYLVAQSVTEVAGAPRYALTVAVKDGQPVATADPFYLLTDPTTKKSQVGDAVGLTDLPDGDVEKSTTGRITKAKGYTILNAREVNARADLKDFAVPTPDGGGIKRVGLSEAFVGKPSLTYDTGSDSLKNATTGKTYVASQDANWVPSDGKGGTLAVGWKENVGLRNFTDALTNPTLRGGFFAIFIWNMVFAVISVLSTFVLGFLLALLFNDDRLRLKGLWRSILILPYALPGFVTALVWRSMFNQDYGLINSFLPGKIDWLGDPTAAKFAILLTNLWLGFPYMFLVCTGALQSIPGDVREAAKIDGATGWRTVRSIIMPLMLVAVGPLLLASFAFNFNNFALIFLLTDGGPFENNQTSVGSTDLLITYAYRLAIGGTTPNFGYASAISIFIFIIVALISLQGFRKAAALEEVN
ncbi:ABC transporter permease subunit [Lapillicoccus sp.]|uniref:ABC transporter permease subunit n=1 Tax=Lapillicoccus sp. TaxID=1909287 RepID=UPI003983B28A